MCRRWHERRTRDSPSSSSPPRGALGTLGPPSDRRMDRPRKPSPQTGWWCANDTSCDLGKGHLAYLSSARGAWAWGGLGGEVGGDLATELVGRAGSEGCSALGARGVFGAPPKPSSPCRTDAPRTSRSRRASGLRATSRSGRVGSNGRRQEPATIRGRPIAWRASMWTSSTSRDRSRGANLRPSR